MGKGSDPDTEPVLLQCIFIRVRLCPTQSCRGSGAPWGSPAPPPPQGQGSASPGIGAGWQPRWSDWLGAAHPVSPGGRVSSPGSGPSRRALIFPFLLSVPTSALLPPHQGAWALSPLRRSWILGPRSRGSFSVAPFQSVGSRGTGFHFGEAHAVPSAGRLG